jgi:sugar/nucleoside kinase (ribokinase family)
VTTRFDVLGLGIVTVDDVLLLPHFPEPDSKLRVDRSLRSIGGLTGAALVTAARLGGRCGYAGCLGDDPLSSYLRDKLAWEGIDLSALDSARRVPPIHSTILVDAHTGSRTILFELPEPIEFGGDWPHESVIRDARVLFIDHYDADRTIRAARIARDAKIPTVADLERTDGPRFQELLSLADHLILGAGFAREISGCDELSRAITRLWSDSREIVIITEGARGCLVADSPNAAPLQIPAFEVPVVDTTGCGDVFHGAYALALAWDWSLLARVRFASAAAALRAATFGGEAGIPHRAAVDQLLAEHSA